jgi:ribosome-associated protein
MPRAYRRPPGRNDLPTGNAPGDDLPSKTRLKRDMEALQALGETLVGLDPSRLASLGLPERLADAIGLARGITRHEARRRQMQYVGKLMRDVDPAPIRAALERFDSVPRAEKARFAALERWRDRLLEDAQALDAFVAAHPSADRQALARAIVAARAERASGGAPKAFRELFRAIRRAVGDAPATEPAP